MGRRIYDARGRVVKYVGKIVDVSEEYELLEQSSTDALTRAYNRSYLQGRLREYCASKQPDVSYACLLADVDYFKSVNDKFGHLVGDNLLTAFVDTARTLFRTSDIVARLGGDEFMVFMRDVYDPRVAMAVSYTHLDVYKRQVEACACYAEGVAQRTEAGEDGPQRVSVEYTRLFVGPPSPAAPPWETMYRGKDVTVGFGQPTFEMRELLRAAGLEVRNANNQYEDHMGIELLYLSELCRREAMGKGAAEVADIAAFVERHPLSWIGPFLDRVSEAVPGGYFAGLLLVAQRVLEHHARLLAR